MLMRYEDEVENIWNCGSWFEYLTIVILIFTRWRSTSNTITDNPQLQFNLHPVLMIAGFVTFSEFSIRLFRLCRCLEHIYVKLAHMFFHVLAIPCVAFGFLSVFDSHNLSQPPKENFFSLHSWLGLVTMGLFVFQFVGGFFSFLVLLCCKNAIYGFRAAMVPIHASFGLVNFMLAIATCLTGLVEKERELTEQKDLSISKFEHYVMNSLGIFLVAIGIIVSFAVRRSNSPVTAKVYVTECL